MHSVLWTLIALVFAGAANASQPSASERATGTPISKQPAPLFDSGLGRGVNFGNMLEAPNEGDWGLTVEEVFFDLVTQAGFEHIRLPISWTHHADLEPPYTIDPVFMARVDWCVDHALARGLKIIVNNHHHDALNDDPAAESPRALAIWSQIAAHMQGRPTGVYFEVLNEPHGVFNDDPALWDAFLADALAVIRQTNPTRRVLAGPVRWNSIGALGSFEPPADDRLILTVHYYDPFEFTHQGASWVDPSPPIGVVWTGDEHTFGPRWDNWSWGTGVTQTDDGLLVDYQQGWAGLYFHRDTPRADLRRVVFEVDRAMSLNVIVGSDDDDQAFGVQTQAGVGEYSVDLPPGFAPADRVMIQNATSGPAPAFTLSAIRVETDRRAEPLIVTQAQDIDAALRRAARWANRRNMPVYLGEFGAYSAADMDSRVLWTRAVRQAAERHGVAWGYWELAAGFGIWDPGVGAWREELLGALID